MTHSNILELGKQAPQGGFGSVPTRLGAQPEQPVAQIPQVVEGLRTLGAQLVGIHKVCAEACATQGDYKGALAHIRCAAALEPDSADLRCQVGFLRYVEGDDGAITDFQAAIDKDPRHADSYFNIGMILFGQGRTAEAERSFAICAQLRPDDAECWNNLGVVRFQLGRTAEAKTCFERSIQLDPSYDEAKANLADLG